MHLCSGIGPPHGTWLSRHPSAWPSARFVSQAATGDLLSVSIVVPVYNGAETIRGCLDALLHLDYPSSKHEILIVDNNSTDDTVGVVREYPVTLLHQRSVQTSYAARNTGISQCRGDIVAFTDADCIADPLWLRMLVRPFRDSAVAGVRGRVLSVQPSTRVEEFTASIDPLRVQYLGDYLSMITANVAYRREILSLLEGFRGNLATGADVDLGMRIQERTDCRVVYAPDAIVLHKHRTTLGGLYRQYHRYGQSEILIDTLHRHKPSYPRKPRQQLATMLKQLRALLVYAISFCFRLLRSTFVQWDAEYVLHPILLFVVESGNLLGKIRGIVQTRGFRRKRVVGCSGTSIVSCVSSEEDQSSYTCSPAGNTE